MNKRLLLLLVCAGNAVAESDNLPTVEENSINYRGGYNSVQGIVPTASTSANKGIYELMGQMEQLQKEVRQLSGTVEEQAHEIAELQKRQSTMYDDIDQRLQSVETGKTGASGTVDAGSSAPLESAVPPPDSPPSVPENQSAPMTPPAAEPAPPVVPQVQLTPPAEATGPETTKYPKEIYSESKDIKTPSVKKPEKEQYQTAYDTLRDGHYSRAIESFKAFLNDYPNGEYAANAQYWLGEAYKVTQNISAARDAFNNVISRYPTSPKVPDAMLKLGYLELEQDNVAKAKELLNKVSNSYPNTSAAHLAAKKLSILNGGVP